MDSIVLKPGKEKAIRQKHHWVFSGAIAQFPECETGSLLPVYSSKGEFLGSGYFNRSRSIAGRMVSFDETSPHQAIETSLKNAIELRKQLFSSLNTTAYRLVNAEGDFLPGLI